MGHTPCSALEHVATTSVHHRAEKNQKPHARSSPRVARCAAQKEERTAGKHTVVIEGWYAKPPLRLHMASAALAPSPMNDIAVMGNGVNTRRRECNVAVNGGGGTTATVPLPRCSAACHMRRHACIYVVTLRCVSLFIRHAALSPAHYSTRHHVILPLLRLPPRHRSSPRVVRYVTYHKSFTRHTTASRAIEGLCYEEIHSEDKKSVRHEMLNA